MSSDIPIELAWFILSFFNACLAFTLIFIYVELRKYSNTILFKIAFCEVALYITVLLFTLYTKVIMG